MPIWDRVLFPVMLPIRLKAPPAKARPVIRVRPTSPAMATPALYIEYTEKAALIGSLFSPYAGPPVGSPIG